VVVKRRRRSISGSKRRRRKRRRRRRLITKIDGSRKVSIIVEGGAQRENLTLI